MKRTIFIAILGLFTLTGCGSSEDNQTEGSIESSTQITTTTITETSETVASSSSIANESTDEASYKDRTLEAPDGILKITGFERGQDYDGTPMFYVFFDLTNKSDEAQNIQMLYMSFVSASQNTGATTETLDMAFTIDGPYQEKEELLQKDLNPGQTISSVYSYTFADETKPVTFEFTESMFSFSGPIAVEDIEIP